MFATDRDLLTLEPNLPRDIGWIGQRLVKGVGDVAGTTLTMTEQDIGFDIVGVETGHIAVVGGTAYEILDVIDNTRLTLSRLRADPEGPALPPSPVTGADVRIPTYTPQIALAHAQLLAMLGIDGDDLTEASITNPGELAHFESLSALHLIFTAAAALATDTSPAAFKAALYRDRLAAERARVTARIDTTGDGRPDATRRPSAISLIRA